MSDFEKYVERAATAIDPAAFDESLENYAGPVRQFRRDKASDQARAMLAAVGPLIAEDTRVRMVEAAGRALEREGCEDAADKARREYAEMDERHLNSCIWIDPGRQVGMPCFGGTRVPVAPVMEIVEEAGEDAARALWPTVTAAHIEAGRLWRKRYRWVKP